MTEFKNMHPVVQQFTQECLRPALAWLSETEELTIVEKRKAIAELRQMLVATAKGTIDIEMDWALEGPPAAKLPAAKPAKAKSGIVLAPSWRPK